MSFLRTGLTRTLQIAALLALWQVVHFFTQSVFFTSPTEVFKAFWQLSTVGDMQGITLQKNLWTSFFRVLHGFLWGLVLLTWRARAPVQASFNGPVRSPPEG